MEVTHDSAPHSDRATDAEVMAIFEGVITCEPAITDAQVDEIERDCQDPIQAVGRRIGLLLAAQRGKWFKKLSEDKEMAQPFAESLPCVDDYIKRMRALADLLEMGHTRARGAVQLRGV